MGLLDMLTGSNRGYGYGGGRGMSPIAMAALGLLAYKAIKGSGNQRQPSAAMASSGNGSILESLGLGTGGSLGGILSGGLRDLVGQFQNAGKGAVAGSWVSNGQNEPIAPADLENVLTPEQIQFLTEKTGLSREELLAGLSKQLPETVDQLTPAGRLPSPQDIDRV